MIDTQEYIVNPESLDKPRPLGISGILRCKNCADFLEECIESCIDALDELVVVFNNCIDETEEILYRMQKVYPDKIKIYPYEPFVYPINLTPEQYAEAMSLSPNSIHLLSGYCNYVISKTTYQYIVKIDADQIIFKDKFARICNAYRATHKAKVTLLECIAYNMHLIYNHSYQRKEMQNYRWLEHIAVTLYPYYFSYVEKMVINEKAVISLSGVNVYTNGESWLIGLSKEGTDILPPFNGTRDLFFFQASSSMTMVRKASCVDRNHYRVLEILYCNCEILDIGFYWFHVRANMTNYLEHSHELYQKFPECYISLQRFRKSEYKSLLIYKAPNATFTESLFSYFHAATRKQLPWEMLEKLRSTYNSYQSKLSKHQESKDYAEEFKNELQRNIRNFLEQCRCTDPYTLLAGDYNLEQALSVYLLRNMAFLQKDYISSRKRGGSIDSSIKEALSYLEHFVWEKTKYLYDYQPPSFEKAWRNILSEYQEYVLTYVHDEKQLNDILPIICQQDYPVLLLTDYELPDDIEVPESVIALTLELVQEQYLYGPNLKRNFPLLYQYANTFEILVQLLSPSRVVCQSPILYQEILLKTIVEHRQIPFLENLNSKP